MQTYEAYLKTTWMAAHPRQPYAGPAQIDKSGYTLCHRDECPVWFQPWFDGYEHDKHFFCSIKCMLEWSHGFVAEASLATLILDGRMQTPRMRLGQPIPTWPKVSTFDPARDGDRSPRWKEILAETTAAYERIHATAGAQGRVVGDRCGKPRTDGKPCRIVNPCWVH